MQQPETYDQLLTTIDQKQPPRQWPVLLKAVWWDARGNWEEAHHLVDSLSGNMSNRIHAYLHRKEGDEGNARYWYNRAGKPFPKESLDVEIKGILEDLNK